jgi:hypothetical protein
LFLEIYSAVKCSFFLPKTCQTLELRGETQGHNLKVEGPNPSPATIRLFGHASDGDFDIAAKDAFDQSDWSLVRKQFQTDAIPRALLFPDPSLGHRHRWDDPTIARFCWDVGRNPALFDLDRAVAITADHQPNPIRREWIQGKFVYEGAFEPMIDDQGHGDAVNFTWRLLKAGYATELFGRVSRLTPDKADKIFAMLACSTGKIAGRRLQHISPCPIYPQ